MICWIKTLPQHPDTFCIPIPIVRWSGRHDAIKLSRRLKATKKTFSFAVIFENEKLRSICVTASRLFNRRLPIFSWYSKENDKLDEFTSQTERQQQHGQTVNKSSSYTCQEKWIAMHFRNVSKWSNGKSIKRRIIYKIKSKINDYRRIGREN